MVSGPFAKGGSALVQPADQMEEQLSAGLSEGQIAELVEHDKIETGQVIGEPPLATGAGFALQAVYSFFRLSN
jgi:hypothetical protein